MKTRFLVIVTIISMASVGILAALFSISYAENSSDKQNPTDRIEVIAGHSFFVSKPYEIGLGSTDVLSFHGIKFTHPSYNNPPDPGGSVKSIIIFEDGTEKKIGFLGPGPSIMQEGNKTVRTIPEPVLIEHNNMFAGLLHDFDGVHLLVSSDSTMTQSSSETQQDTSEKNQDIQPQSIEEKLQIARKYVMPESDKPGSSGPPIFDASATVTPFVIVGGVVATGSFLGLMLYWRKK